MKVPEGSGGGERGEKQFVQRRQRGFSVDRPRDRKRSRPGGDDRTSLWSDGLWQAKYQAGSGDSAWATRRREVHAGERKAGMSCQFSDCLVGWQTSEHRSAFGENGRVEQGRRCPARQSATLTPSMHGGLSIVGKQVTRNLFSSCCLLLPASGPSTQSNSLRSRSRLLAVTN